MEAGNAGEAKKAKVPVSVFIGNSPHTHTLAHMSLTGHFDVCFLLL